MVKGESGNNVTTVHRHEILLQKCTEQLKTCGNNLWHLNTYIHEEMQTYYTYTNTNYSDYFVEKKYHCNHLQMFTDIQISPTSDISFKWKVKICFSPLLDCY